MAALSKYSLVISVTLLTLVLIAAACLGSAELLGMSANQEMERWSQERRMPTAEESQSVATRLDWAIGLTGFNPAFHESLARLELLRATQLGLSAQSRAECLELARAQIHRAITLRPVSPYGWTLLLLIKRELREYDEEFRHALHRAVELGPWEPTLLPQLADVGLSAWSDLPVEERTVIGQVFVRGMKRQPQTMFDVVRAHRKPCAEAEAVCNE